MYNTIYPGFVPSYYNNINQRQVQQKNEDEKSSSSSRQAQKETKDTFQRNNQYNTSYFPNGEKTAIDYTKKQIGIEQILSDFKNTISAIGTPDDIKQEVTTYLNLVENQAKKNTPNVEIIQSNLKNASKILDNYITDTLKKPSKVVEEWVDTLFMQSVDYKSKAETIVEQENIDVSNETITQNEEVTLEEQTAQNIEETLPQNFEQPVIAAEKEIYIPENERLKRMFIQAKKYALTENKDKALYNFKNSLDYAQEIGDERTQAMIYYEEGQIYTDFNRVEDALFNYNQAILKTDDNNLKARAHLSMGKIYNDYVNFEPAVEHLSMAAAYSGEADNLKIQSKALSDLAQIHTQRYDKQNADMFMKLAAISANSSDI